MQYLIEILISVSRFWECYFGFFGSGGWCWAYMSLFFFTLKSPFSASESQILVSVIRLRSTVDHFLKSGSRFLALAVGSGPGWVLVCKSGVYTSESRLWPLELILGLYFRCRTLKVNFEPLEGALWPLRVDFGFLWVDFRSLKVNCGHVGVGFWTSGNQFWALESQSRASES